MKLKRISIKSKNHVVKRMNVHDSYRQTPDKIDYLKFEPMREHPGFEINRMGDIRAVNPTYRVERWKGSGGYLNVTFYTNNNRSMDSVHRAVAKQFRPNENASKLVVHHKDADRQNNCIDNLEWCTQSENSRHAHSKLTDEDILNIRRLSKGGCSRKQIHAAYNFVSQAVINDVISYRTFKYLE